MNRWLLCSLSGLLSCCIVHGLECQVFQHANGFTSYNLTGGESSTNCSVQWSDNGTSIALKDEYLEEKHEEVLSQDANGILLRICRKDVHYKEDCPTLGVVNRVPCPCNCSSIDAGQPKVNGMETHSSEGGSNRTHIVAMISPIFVSFIILIIVCYCYCRGNSSGGWCAGEKKGDKHRFPV